MRLSLESFWHDFNTRSYFLQILRLKMRKRFEKIKSKSTSELKHLIKSEAKKPQNFNLLNKIGLIYRSCIQHPNFLSFSLLFTSTFCLVFSMVLMIDGFFCYGGLPETDLDGKYKYDENNKLILKHYQNIWFWERNCSFRCTGKDETEYCEPALNLERFVGAILLFFGVLLGAVWRDSMDINKLTRKRENEIDLSTTKIWKLYLWLKIQIIESFSVVFMVVLTTALIASPVDIKIDPKLQKPLKLMKGLYWINPNHPIKN